MAQKSTKPRKSQASARIRKLDTSLQNKKIGTILIRQIEKLMCRSLVEELSKDDMTSLSMCKKILREFEAQEDEQLDNLPIEELEKLT